MSGNFIAIFLAWTASLTVSLANQSMMEWGSQKRFVIVESVMGSPFREWVFRATSFVTNNSHTVLTLISGSVSCDRLTLEIMPHYQYQPILRPFSPIYFIGVLVARGKRGYSMKARLGVLYSLSYLNAR